jgi:SSS family solute:Na+ symporter
MTTITTEHWNSLLTALGILAFMTWLATRKSKNISEEDYLVGGRDVAYGPLSAAIAAGVVGGGILLVYTEYAFRFGLAALFIIGGIVLGTALMVPVAKKFKRVADAQMFYSLPDLYHYLWGPRAGFLATVTIFFWTAGFILMQLISAGEVLRAMTGVPYWVGVVLAAGTVASYLLVAGFRAVVITDILQYTALVVLMLIVFIPATLQVNLGTAFIGAATVSFDWGEAIGFFVLGALNMIVSADMWQRVYAARNESHAKRAFGLAAVLVAFAGILLLIPPLYARTQLPTIASNEALYRSLELLLPRWLLGFGLVGVLATIIACLDTMVFVLGISIGHDLRVRQLERPVEDRLRSTRITILLTLVAGSIISILFQQLMALGLALSMLGLILTPSIVMNLFGKPLTRKSVETGMALGLLSTAAFLVSCIAHPSWLTPQNALIALVGAIVGSVIGRWLK